MLNEFITQEPKEGQLVTVILNDNNGNPFEEWNGLVVGVKTQEQTVDVLVEIDEPNGGQVCNVPWNACEIIWE